MNPTVCLKIICGAKNNPGLEKQVIYDGFTNSSPIFLDPRWPFAATKKYH
jgi:hypothetical protein